MIPRSGQTEVFKTDSNTSIVKCLATGVSVEAWDHGDDHYQGLVRVTVGMAR